MRVLWIELYNGVLVVWCFMRRVVDVGELVVIMERVNIGNTIMLLVQEK